jgi:Domain of unknown function (DUF1772)
VLHAWSFLTISLAALLMGCTFCHVLEIPAKLKMEAPFWMTLQQRLYRTFAPIGGSIEITAILAAAVLAFLVRDDQRVFYMTLGAAISLAGAFFVVWLMFTNTVNVEVSKWKARAIPKDWKQWRTQWEFSHAGRFVLQLIGFSALLLSVLIRLRPA